MLTNSFMRQYSLIPKSSKDNPRKTNILHFSKKKKSKGNITVYKKGNMSQSNKVYAGLIIWKEINVIHNINKLIKTKHIIISKDPGKKILPRKSASIHD